MILNKLLKLKRPIFPSYYKTIKHKYDFIEMDVLNNKKKISSFYKSYTFSPNLECILNKCMSFIFLLFSDNQKMVGLPF